LSGPTLRTFLRSISISAAVAVLTTLTILFVAYLVAPVTGIRVEGARMFPETGAWNAVPVHASLLTLNAKMLERRVESNPWVKGAEVSKNWESGIVTIQVKERRPVLDG
jgi:cell division septal protein FtsQ